jgi:transposase
MNKNLKATPKFKSEAQERTYWETHDSSEHIDWSKAARVRLFNLKPSPTDH